MKTLFFVLITVLATTCASNSNDPAKEIREALESGKDLYFENQTFTEDIDLTTMLPSIMISEGIYQVRTASAITFKNCTFEGKVLAYKRNDEGKTVIANFQSSLSFIGCSFEKEVNFKASSVLGRVDFTGSFFESTANFEECSFFQNAFFSRCAFHKEVRFQNAVFMQRANFMNVEFDENASFQGSTFTQTAQFSNLKSFGYADFTLIKWNDGCFFNYAEFNDRAIFNSSTFMHWADFLNVKFGYAEMNNNRFFGLPSLKGSTIEKTLSFTGNFFLQDKPDLSFFDQEKLVME